ncbi:RNA pseudouridylate synthase domain-containing 1 isoform X1 [Pelobates cultripes]|uniref:RNA pseudouridylate synthase domain-containing 1 isoform X1 n=1 Tax=Pelobates cultripes TaxID=61616 RepID=A0AAD1WT20_PELCU|nr:RNA pseudouridylate synthase domain-containing 1 isoform X1 [Pelobates cultripes]
MPNCVVFGCPRQPVKNNPDMDVRLHCFPKDPERVKLWLMQTRQHFRDIDKVVVAICDGKRNNNYRLCSRHFTKDCYTINGTHKSLNKYAIPTIFPTGTGLPCIDEDMFFKRCFKLHTDLSMCTPTSIKDLLSFTKILCDVSTSTNDYVCTREVSTQTESISLKDAIELSKSSQHIHTSISKRMSVEHCYAKMVNNTSVSKTQRKRKRKSNLIKSKESSQFEQELFEQSSEEPLSPTNSFNEEAEMSPHSEELHLAYSQQSRVLSKDLNDAHQRFRPLESSPRELRKSSAQKLINERKFIVFESCIDALCYKVTCQSVLNCKGRIIDLKKKTEGTYLHISATCEKGHQFSLWESQPKISKIGAGNILLAASILFSGSHFSKVQELLHIFGLQQISKSAYCRYQHRYLYGSIYYHWQLERDRVKEVCKDRPLCLMGNRQYENPELGHKYCMYTFIDVGSKNIVDFEVVEVYQGTSSVTKEERGFQMCLDRLRTENLDVHIIATDKHLSIEKLMQEHYEDIDHQYNVWNYAKELKKNLMTLSQKKNCSEISNWIEAIMDHFWWSIKTCNGEINELRERWQSLLYHVSGQHEWVGRQRYCSCFHDPISAEENVKTKWIAKNSPAFENLVLFVTDEQLHKDLIRLVHFCHTDAIGSFHNMFLKYRPKRLDFGMDSLDARTVLAILAHNHNVEIKQESVKERFMFPNTLFYRKRWVVRTGDEPMSNEHIEDMLLTVLRVCSGSLT